MSLILPPKGHPAREMIDIQHIASLGDVQNQFRLPTIRQVKENAARAFAADPAIRRVNSLVLRANGNLDLISFGPRGGAKTMWKFGRL